MAPNAPNARGGGRRPGRGVRPWLILAKLLGLSGFFGGLAALAAIGFWAPTPRDEAGWALLQAIMRAVFRPCVLGGLLLAVGAGLALFSRHPREFLRMRWFRVKALLLVVCLPALHLWARGRVTAFYAAIDAGDLERLPGMWRGVTEAFVVALVVMLCIALIGRLKPRLGEPIGSRRRKGGHSPFPPGDRRVDR